MFHAIKDISLLAELNNLKYLSLGGNQITDFSQLSGLAKLTSLQIANNPEKTTAR